MEAIRILIADDANIIRHTLCKLLERETGIEVVGEAATGLEAVDKAAELRPDVVLMDADMPDLDGIEATRRIRALGLPSKIIVLTVIGSRLFEALSAGASEYLFKDCTRAGLVAKIRQVAAEIRCTAARPDNAQSAQ